jgi:hypothetical protein
VVREDVFGPGEFGAVGGAMRWAHVTTREFVVRRELLLRPGDTYDSVLVAETERNLRALGIFRRALVDTVRDGDRLVLRVTTQDGWTTTPVFDIATSEGQTSIAIGLVEGNFLGRAAVAGARYRSTPDRTSWLLAYRQPRAIAGRIGVTAQWDARSDGRALFASMGQPFLALSGRWAWGTDVTDFDGDVLRFRDGDPAPFVVLRRRFFLASAFSAHALAASPRGYLRVGLSGQLRRDDFVPQPIDGVAFPESWTGAAGPYLEWARARFVVLRNVASFLREEDQSVGVGVRVGVLAAPRLFGYERDGVGGLLSAGAGVRIPGGFARADVGVTGLVDAGGLDSGTVTLKARAVVQPSARHALLLGGFLGWQDDPVPGAEFDFGLGAVLRAYPIHAFTGDRAWYAVGEYRWTVAPDAFGLLGLALGAFAGAGGAWFDGDPQRSGAEAGVGLRFGPSRLASASLFRLDAAYRTGGSGFAPGWSLVFARGFTF